MNTNRIAIVCNGSVENYPLIQSRIQSFPTLVAVNGGTAHCHAMGLQPDLIVGDLDSTTPEILAAYAHVPQQKYPILKDKTDLELTLEYLMTPDVQEITLFGALGKRLDHTLTNCLLLTRYPGIVYIESAFERLVAINKQLQLTCRIGQPLSLIPLNGPVSGINTLGLRWNLSDGLLDKSFIGISNTAEQLEIKITVEDGDLLCWYHL